MPKASGFVPRRRERPPKGATRPPGCPQFTNTSPMQCASAASSANSPSRPTCATPATVAATIPCSRTFSSAASVAVRAANSPKPRFPSTTTVARVSRTICGSCARLDRSVVDLLQVTGDSRPITPCESTPRRSAPTSDSATSRAAFGSAPPRTSKASASSAQYLRLNHGFQRAGEAWATRERGRFPFGSAARLDLHLLVIGH